MELTARLHSHKRSSFDAWGCEAQSRISRIPFCTPHPICMRSRPTRYERKERSSSQRLLLLLRVSCRRSDASPGCSLVVSRPDARRCAAAVASHYGHEIQQGAHALTGSKNHSATSGAAAAQAAFSDYVPAESACTLSAHLLLYD